MAASLDGMSQEERSQLLLEDEEKVSSLPSDIRWKPERRCFNRRNVLVLVSIASVLCFIPIAIAIVSLSRHALFPPNLPAQWRSTGTSNEHLSLPDIAEISHLEAPHEAEVLDCGEDMFQAMDRECVYDALLSGWVPKSCFNASLYDEFSKNEHSYKWFRTPSGVNTVSLSLLETGRYMEVYTSHEFRVHQCSYIWRKQITAMELDEAWIEDRVMDTAYLRDCTHWIMQAYDGDDRSSVANFQIQHKCRKYTGSLS